MQRRALPLLLAFLAACAGIAPLARAATLEASAQQRIRAATFEVVQRKPEDGPVTYERPLPTELIPYQERIDKYRSVGTAFAIGPNRYVTAGHVFTLGSGSQYGPPSLRDATGNVYEVDKVWKFSDHEDFVEFSLRTEPKGVQVLELGTPPALNDPVFAVGNALGEGIVIRDGVYTSDTPEELNGEWKWLRFTAAASPGNSGGPLVDQSGHVIGVVVRKSESENLNYALPIARVSASADGEGKIEDRLPIRFPLFDAVETRDVHTRVPLPKTPPELFAAVQAFTLETLASSYRDLFAHNQDRLFPNSAGSSQLLHSDLTASFLRTVREGQDRIWQASSEHGETYQLEQNGFVETSQGIARLRLPDNVSLSALYGDSKLYMDLLLKVIPVRRQIASESIKVTSLGKAQWSEPYTDAYGRHWQMFAWAEPWDDVMLVSMSLPTPQGYVSFLAPIPTAYWHVAVEVDKLLTGYSYASMGGTLAQWRDYLAQKNVAPKVFSSFKLDIDPEQAVKFRSPRCELEVTKDLLPLSRDSVLWLNFEYYRDGANVVWDIGGITVGETTQKHNFVEAWRNTEPDAALPESFQSHWRKIQAREFPFNGMVSNSNGSTRISAPADPPAGKSDPKIRYVLTLINEGDQSQDVMSPRLEILKRSFKALE